MPRQIVALAGKHVNKVACGGQHSLALIDGEVSRRGHGTLFSWGRGKNGRLGLGDHNDQVGAVTACTLTAVVHSLARAVGLLKLPPNVGFGLK